MTPEERFALREQARAEKDIYTYAMLTWGVPPEQVDADLAAAGLSKESPFQEKVGVVGEAFFYRTHKRALEAIWAFKPRQLPLFQ